MTLDCLSHQARHMEQQWVVEVHERRALHNKLQDMVGNLRVLCRVRPFTKAERSAEAVSVVEVDARGEKLTIEHQAAGEKVSSKREFDFTHVFGPDSTQEDIFHATSDLMTSVLDGYNVCIFAYGQSGTGKTYTMEGTDSDPGLAPRAMARLFEIVEKHHAGGNFEHSCYLSMLEIYNEGIRDLLSDPNEATAKKYAPL